MTNSGHDREPTRAQKSAATLYLRHFKTHATHMFFLRHFASVPFACTYVLIKGLPHAKKTSTTARERANWASPAASRLPSFVHTTVPRLPSRVGAKNPPQPSTALRGRGTGPSTQRQPHPMAGVPSCPGGNTSQTCKNRRGLRR